MDEKAIEKIWDAYNKAAPHLCEFVWLKKVISEIIPNAKNLEMLINALYQEIQKEKTISRKTDLKIFIFYLNSK
ncbi:MAG: hypothetical protein ACETWM_04865 [Candidatus Lokiarchaeia archaeon]